MTLFVVIAGLALLTGAGTLALLRAVKQAKVGYKDEHGFHFAETLETKRPFAVARTTPPIPARHGAKAPGTKQAA